MRRRLVKRPSLVGVGLLLVACTAAPEPIPEAPAEQSGHPVTRPRRLAVDLIRSDDVPRADPFRPREVPEELDTRRRRVSEAGHFTITVTPMTQFIALNTIHNWSIALRDRVTGEPIDDAAIGFDGGMPAHDHGFPTDPRVTRSIGRGLYLVEGVKFNMTGWWEFLVTIDSGEISDRAIFNLIVTEAPWSDAELAELRALWIGRLGDPPFDPSNRYADSDVAARLGKRLFFDGGLSASGERSCASCHRPELLFTDGLARALDDPRLRGTPSILASSWSPWFYWDGRRDSQWAQALTPIEAPLEMGGSRVAVVRRLACDDAYRRMWQELEGAPELPSCAAARALPEATPLGTPDQQREWASLDAAERDAVDRIFAVVGKALAAYQRRLRPGPARFDRYVERLLAGESGEGLLDPDEIAGLRLFTSSEAQCLRCHNGPLFTNHGFHNIGLPTPEGHSFDAGRLIGIEQAQRDPFNCLGPHSDADERQCLENRFVKRSGEELNGAFKVPSLRGAAETAPYMHDGQLKTLGEVLAHYATPPPGGPGHQELTPLRLTSTELGQIVAFLKSLTPEKRDDPWAAPP